MPYKKYTIICAVLVVLAIIVIYILCNKCFYKSLIGASIVSLAGVSIILAKHRTISGSAEPPKPKYPYISDILSLEEVKKRAKEFRNALKLIKIDNQPYKPLTLIEKAGIVGDKLAGKYVRFVSNWADTSRYDDLALYFSEEALLDCSTIPHKSLRENFALQGQKLYKPDPTEFRDAIFKNIKFCHNFRCLLAAKIYDYFKAHSVLDFSAGWGDRLFAACALGIEYLGIDPNLALRKPYDDIIGNVGDSAKQKVITSGSEYLDDSSITNRYDLLFTSPPYFDYEVYSSGPQSISEVSSFESWLVNFLLFTIAKYSKFINKNIVIYIQDVGQNAYLEPIVLFMQMYYSLLGFKYLGTFSANKFPLIVFEKSASSEDPRDASEKMEKYYPKIFTLLKKLEMAGIRNDYGIIRIPSEPSKHISGNNTLERVAYKFMLVTSQSDITLQGFNDEPWDTLADELKKIAKIFNCEILSKSSRIIKPEMLKDLLWNSFRELFLTMLVDTEAPISISVPKTLEDIFKKLFPLATVGQETEAQICVTF